MRKITTAEQQVLKDLETLGVCGSMMLYLEDVALEEMSLREYWEDGAVNTEVLWLFVYTRIARHPAYFDTRQVQIVANAISYVLNEVAPKATQIAAQEIRGCPEFAYDELIKWVREEAQKIGEVKEDTDA